MDHKINVPSDNKIFVKTQAYIKLKSVLEDLKYKRGNVIHVIGTPGTGKSANIYHAIDELGLKVYNVECNLKDLSATPQEVFKTIIDDIKKSLDVKRKYEAYRRLSDFDAILFADRFHDNHLLKDDVHGFSEWTLKSKRTPYFYLLCIREYLKYREMFKNLNIIFQTAWRLKLGDRKYDIFTDIPLLSGIFSKILGTIFTVVRIEYTPKETIKIVKAHLDIEDWKIKKYIKVYGCRPRYILDKLKG
ncbi:MAG: ATP-binding protein [Methanothermobacter sp.]|nr:ATP-binding protein [Methanothermobacter sp.]